MVKGLLEEVADRVKPEYLSKHRVFGEKKFKMHRQILYHSFKRVRKEDRSKFLQYFRAIDHMMGDVLYIKRIHTSLHAHPKVMFIGQQSHANTIAQYLKHGLKWEVVYEQPAAGLNMPVEMESLNKCLSSFKKRKRNRKKKNKNAQSSQAESKAKTNTTPESAAAAGGNTAKSLTGAEKVFAENESKSMKKGDSAAASSDAQAVVDTPLSEKPSSEATSKNTKPPAEKAAVSE